MRVCVRVRVRSACLHALRKVCGNKLVLCVQMLYWFTQSDFSQTPTTMDAVWYKLLKIFSGCCRTSSINSSKLLCETLITGMLEVRVRRQRCRRAQTAGCLDCTWSQAKATYFKACCYFGICMCAETGFSALNRYMEWSLCGQFPSAHAPAHKETLLLKWPWAIFFRTRTRICT